MLDLNLDVESTESTQNRRDLTKGVSGGAMDESVTSNSSVVNADASSCIDGEEELCSTRAVKFQFEILKGGLGGEEDEEEEEEVEGRSVVMMTKEFFPVATKSDGDCVSYLDSNAQSSRSSVDISFQRGKQGGDFLSGCGSGGDGLRVMQPPAQPVKKSRRGPRSKSSQYRGVTFYRRTGRWESHIWDCGKQVYLGGFDTAHAAARAYDRAAVKFRGLEADINFIISDYEEDIKQMANLSKEEVVQVLRRQSSGFSRNNLRHQGVAMQKIGGWGAQMEQFHGNMACDKAAIKWNGREAASFIEPHASRMIPEAANVMLDLNLRISLSLGDSPKQKDRSLRFHNVPNGIICGRSSKVYIFLCSSPDMIYFTFRCVLLQPLLKCFSVDIYSQQLKATFRLTSSSPRGSSLIHEFLALWFALHSQMENNMAAATCNTPFNFLKRGSDHISNHHGLPPAFFSHTERTSEKGLMLHPSQSLQARTWQAQDQSSGGTATVLNAASSGFSLAAATHPPSSTATLHPSQPFLNLNLPGLYVIHPNDYTSQQHHHHLMNRPQAPP